MSGILKIIDLNAVWDCNLEEAISHFFCGSGHLIPNHVISLFFLLFLPCVNCAVRLHLLGYICIFLNTFYCNNVCLQLTGVSQHKQHLDAHLGAKEMLFHTTYRKTLNHQPLHSPFTHILIVICWLYPYDSHSISASS